MALGAQAMVLFCGVVLGCTRPSSALTREMCSASTTEIPMSCCPTELLGACCLPIVRPCNETLQLLITELMSNFSRLPSIPSSVISSRRRRDAKAYNVSSANSSTPTNSSSPDGGQFGLQSFSSLVDYLGTQSNQNRKPYCVHPMNSSACLDGFYLDAVESKPKPCPPGFYCPSNQLCIIPCPEGSYCTTDYVVNSTKGSSYGCREAGFCCEPSGGVPVYDPDSGRYICRGSFRPNPCEKGYFCPNVTSRKICPEGYFCREGSVEAQPCPPLASCKVGSSAPVVMTAGVSLLVLIIVFATVVSVCFYYRRTIRFYSHLYASRYLKRDKEAINAFQVDSGLRMAMIGASEIHNQADKIVPKDFQINIAFHNLSLQLKGGSKKKVLAGVTGKINSGEVTAVMGPSGAGKTTFLNTLSGKAYYGNRGGDIFINGVKESDFDKYRTITGFVPQEDVMHRNLTVKEVLRYQAELRLSSSTKSSKKHERVQQIIELLQLERIQDSQIGDEENRGISGGQRKRVNIGMELVVDPTLLFLDEPTSGLDSTSSLSVLNALRAVAEKGRLTIVCVIHQPRFEIFRMFHNLLFLGPGGRTVFQGSVDEAEEYFQCLGFEKPLNVNPADFYMDVIGGVYVKDNFAPSQLFNEWESYQSERDGVDAPVESPHTVIDTSSTANLVASTKGVQLIGMRELNESNGGSAKPVSFEQRKMPNLFAQFLTFYRRENRLLFRILRTLFLDQMMVLVAGLILGALNTEVALSNIFSLQTISCIALGLTAMLPALRYFGNHRVIFWRESASGVNRLSYFLAVDCAQWPIILISPLVYLSLLYSLTIPRGQFIHHYASTVGAWFACNGTGYLLSILLNPRNSQLASVLLALINSLLAGSSPSLCSLDKFTFVGPALYNLSYARWYMESLFEVEANRYPRVMAPLVYGIAGRNGYTLRDYNFALSMLFVLGIGTRILAFVALCLLNRGKQK